MPAPAPPAPMDRRYSNEAAAGRRPLDYVNSAMEAERLGYDSFWTTEHHFQHEGYEVIPNGILISTWIAAQHRATLRLGTMFNVVPQWNPLRLAEDFATLHNLSGGRAILGVGRGTVPREVLHLNDKGVSIGSHDNPDQAADDELNREVFEESMEIVRRALDRGVVLVTRASTSRSRSRASPTGARRCRALSLVPRPLYPFEIWQAVTSPPTLDYVPVVGHGAVFWNQHYSFIKRFWDTYAENYAAAHDGHELADHEKRMLVVNVRVEDTLREGRARRRSPGHDEFWKFLGPYGWSRGYMGADGKPAAPGLIPTLDESIENKTILVGTPEQVAEGVAVLPRPARPRAPHDLPAPARRPVQEGRRADGPLRRRGRPARCPDATAQTSFASRFLRAGSPKSRRKRRSEPRGRRRRAGMSVSRRRRNRSGFVDRPRRRTSRRAPRRWHGRGRSPSPRRVRRTCGGRGRPDRGSTTRVRALRRRRRCGRARSTCRSRWRGHGVPSGRR